MIQQFQQSFLVIPVSLIIFYIYKKFIVKDEDKRIIGDTVIVGILLTGCLMVYSSDTTAATPDTFRTKGNF